MSFDFSKKRLFAFVSLFLVAVLSFSAVAASVPATSSVYIDNSDNIDFDVNDDALNAVSMYAASDSDDYGSVVLKSSKPSWLSDYITLPAVAINSSSLYPSMQYGNGVNGSTTSFTYYFSCSPLNALGSFNKIYRVVHIHSSNGFSDDMPTSLKFSSFLNSSTETFILDTDHSSANDVYFISDRTFSGLTYVNTPDCTVNGFSYCLSGDIYVNAYAKVDYSSVSSVDNSASITVNGGGGSSAS